MLLVKRGLSPAGIQAVIGEPDVLEVAYWRAGVAAITANTVYLLRLPRVVKPRLLSWVEYLCGTAAGNVAAALLTTTDPTTAAADALAATYTRVAHTGGVAAAGVNDLQRLTFAAPYLYLPATDLWVAFGGDTGTLTVGRAANAATLYAPRAIAIAKANAYSSGIPATLTTLSGAVAFQPYLTIG